MVRCLPRYGKLMQTSRSCYRQRVAGVCRSNRYQAPTGPGPSGGGRGRPRADVLGLGADEPAGALLLEDVRRPTGDPSGGEDRSEEVAVDAQRVEQHGGVELDVGVQPPAGAQGGERTQRLALDPLGKGEPAAGIAGAEAAWHRGAGVLAGGGAGRASSPGRVVPRGCAMPAAAPWRSPATC